MMPKANYFRVLAVLTTTAAAVLAASLLVLALAVEPAEAAFPGENGQIAFTGEAAWAYDIYAINPDGSGKTNLTYNPAASSYNIRFDFAPAFSADGKKLAFERSDYVSDTDIYVMNADGSGQAPLTNDSAADSGPAFSPDGTKIAFTSNRDGNYEIYLMNADGTEQTRLTNSPANDSEPTFFPDGTKIAFTSTRDGNYEIYVMDANGDNQTNLTNNPANDFSPDVSPNGNKIAFASYGRDGEGGGNEIYVMNADGSNQTRLTLSYDFTGYSDGYYYYYYYLSEAGAPAFSPDGKKIAFERDEQARWGPDCSGGGVCETYYYESWGSSILTKDADGLPDSPETGVAGGFQPDWGVHTSDTLAPSAPVISSPAEDSYDADGSFAVSGTAEAGSNVTLLETLLEGTTEVGTPMRVDASGKWSVDLSGVADGKHTYTATATDADGNTSAASNPVTVTVDTVAPDPPSISSPADNTLTNNNKPTISGTADAGSTVSVYDDGSTNLGTANAASTGSWSYTPSSALSDDKHSLTAKATDAAGNTSSASDPAVSVSIDTAAPTVSSVSPSENATAVALDESVSATFLEAMDSASLTDQTFYLTKQDTPDTHIGTSITYDAATKKATLTPSATLEAGTTYSATVKGGTGGAKDAAGNTLAADKGWSFTTKADTTDTIPPQTTIASGPNGPTNDNTPTFSFNGSDEVTSEANLLYSYKVDDDDGVDEGQWSSYSPDTSVTLPNLSDGKYIFYVKAKDEAKNEDGSPAQQSFTVDATPPKVSSVSPSDGTTGVGRDTNVKATFSEALDPTTVKSSTFTLVKSGTTTPISASLSYDAASRTATLDPYGSSATLLSKCTWYKATVTSGVKDKATNALAANKVWSFKTRGC